MLESADPVVTEPMCAIHWVALTESDGEPRCPACDSSRGSGLIREIADWWPLLPEGARRWLREDPRRPLNPEILTALILTRGFGPAAVHFGDADDGDARNFFLTESESLWIWENGAP